jgi:hypothetical protein
MSNIILDYENDEQYISWVRDLNVTHRSKYKTRNIHGWEAKVNEAHAIAPYFTHQLLERIHRKLACNVVFVGEAGSGKTYTAMQLARHLYHNFHIDQVVYGYTSYYEFLMDKRYGIGAPSVLDEPQDAIDHREWYKEVQQSIIKTISSQRFMVKPLFIPIINVNLIDKTIRDYLIQYQVECIRPSFARVFRLSPSQKENKTYFNFVCNLRYGLMDNDLCNKPSCLFCKQLETCPIFRAQYERKKARTVYQRVEQAKEEALIKESKDLTLEQILNECYKYKETYTIDHKIHAPTLRIALREHNIIIGHSKAYDLKALLEYRYPDDFTEKKHANNDDSTNETEE